MEENLTQQRITLRIMYIFLQLKTENSITDEYHKVSYC